MLFRSGSRVPDKEESSSVLQTRFKNLNIILNRIVIGVIVIICLSIIIITLIASKIAKALNRMVQVGDTLANYNISQDVEEEYLNRKDEIGMVARSLQTVTGNLRNILSGIASTSSNVAASSEELTAISEQSTVAAQDLSNSITEIASGATIQAESTTEGFGHAQNLGNMISESAEKVSNLEGGFLVLEFLSPKIFT